MVLFFQSALYKSLLLLYFQVGRSAVITLTANWRHQQRLLLVVSALVGVGTMDIGHSERDYCFNTVPF